MQFVLVEELQWMCRKQRRVLFKKRSNRQRERCSLLVFSRIASCCLGCKGKNSVYSGNFVHDFCIWQKGFSALCYSHKSEAFLYLESHYTAATVTQFKPPINPLCIYCIIILYHTVFCIYCTIRFGRSPVEPTSWAGHQKKS